jgi:hypothetical protein
MRKWAALGIALTNAAMGGHNQFAS